MLGAATLGTGGLIGAAATMGARGHVVPPGGAGDGGVAGVRERDSGRGLPYDAMMDHSSGQPPAGSYSNRNSHPFTDREVEQGFQKMEGKIMG